MNSNNKLIKGGSVLVAFFILVLIYIHHFHNGFFYDDVYCIQQNPAIHSLHNIPAFFKDSHSFATIEAYQVYRPFFLVSYAIDYHLGNGLDPVIIHWHTFLGFIILCLLFFLFVKKVFKSIAPDPFYPSLLAVCLFAFHPTTADVINYMYARCDSFAALYGMLAIVLYLYVPIAKKYYLYLIPLFVACLFKINGGFFVPMLWVYLLFFDEDVTGTFAQKLKNSFIRILPAFVVIILAFALTMMGGKLSDTNGVSRTTSLMTQVHVIQNYFMLFFFPENINPNGWRNFIESPTDYHFIIGICFLALMGVVIYFTSLYKSTKPIAFGLLWFLVFLVPTSVFLILTVPQVDYYVFDSMMGISIAVAGLITIFYNRIKEYGVLAKGSTVVVSLLVLVTFAYGSRQRIEVWSSNKAMWADVLKKDPTNGRILMNYGTLLMGDGKIDEAEQYFEKAKQYWPDYDLIYVNMGIIKNLKGDTINAENDFKQAVALNGWDYYMASYYYGSYLQNRRRDAEAIVQLNNALRKNPSYTDAGYLLMNIYWNNHDRAIAATCRQMLSAVPDDSIAKKYLAAYVKDSISFGNQALKQGDLEQFYINNPSEANYINLSLLYFNKREFEKAIDACNEILSINPKSAIAYNNMCAAYNNLQQWTKAIEAGKRALELQPDFELARNNLNFALTQLNKTLH